MGFEPTTFCLEGRSERVNPCQSLSTHIPENLCNDATFGPLILSPCQPVYTGFYRSYLTIF